MAPKLKGGQAAGRSEEPPETKRTSSPAQGRNTATYWLKYVFRSLGRPIAHQAVATGHMKDEIPVRIRNSCLVNHYPSVLLHVK
jgi:hypothetical protein